MTTGAPQIKIDHGNALDWLLLLMTVRSLDVPNGDILIHAGDFTNFGSRDDAIEFNVWLKSLPHRHKIVINGNHENNASWRGETKEILSNATFLKNDSITICPQGKFPVKIHGTDFYWPMRGETIRRPEFDSIEDDINVLITHGPAAGIVDGGKGCPVLRARCHELALTGNLRAVVCGHIHFAHGVCSTDEHVTFVNASCCGKFRKVENRPIVLDI